MMKALLFCPVQSDSELTRYFPDYPVYLLPFANKPAIEFMLDYCFLSGIREIRIVSEDDSEVMRARFRNSEVLGMSISFEGVRSALSLKQVIRQNMAFCRGCDLLVFSGLFLPVYDKRNPHELNIGADGMKGCTYGSAAWYLIGRGRLQDLPDDWSGFHDDAPVNGSAVQNIRDYYQHNMRLAGSDIEKYNLPGFSEGKNSFVGRDVRIPGSARVRQPVILGNWIQFGRGVHAGPNIIVGDNCVIDNGTTIRDSIILGNTYVGRDLEIAGKICSGNHLIDPESGAKVDAINESVLSGMEADESLRYPLYQRVLACVLLLLQTLPYVLLRPFLEIHTTLAECVMSGGWSRTMALNGYALPRESFAGRLFRRLTLNKYHLLPYAAAGKIRLVGNRIFEATEQNERFIRSLSGYAPGIFSYSEYLGHEKEPYQREFDEQYYGYAGNCWFNIKVLTGILLRNLKPANPSLQQRGAVE